MKQKVCVELGLPKNIKGEENVDDAQGPGGNMLADQEPDAGEPRDQAGEFEDAI